MQSPDQPLNAEPLLAIPVKRHLSAGHAVARKQMSAFGAMLSFRVRAGREAALAVVGRAELFTRATSLGGVESLTEQRASSEGPHTTTPQDLIRLSIGLEHADDLIEDLEQALT